MLWFALLPAVSAFKAMVVFQLVVAGLFTYLLARLVGMDPWGALAAGAVFTTGAFLQHNTYCCTIYPGVTTWIPMALVGIELAVRSATWPGRIVSWGLAGFAVSQMMAGWIGQGAYNGLLLVAAYVVYRTVFSPFQPLGVKERAVQLVLQGAGVFALGFALGAAGLLPRLDVNRRSTLAGGYEEVDAGSARGWDYDYLFFQLMNSEITTRRFYVGGAALALSLMAVVLVRRRLAVPYFAFFSVAIAVMTLKETPLHQVLYLLPRYESLHEHTPFRILGLVMLGPAMLAGAMIDTIARRRFSPWSLVLAFVPLLLIDVARGYAIENRRSMDQLPLVAAILATVVAALGIVLALPQVRQRVRVPEVARYVVPILLIAILLWDPWARFFVRSVRAEERFPRHEQAIVVNAATTDPGGAGEFLQGELARSSEPFRYFGYDAIGLRTADPPEWLDQTGSTYHARRERPEIQALLVSARAARLGLYDIQGYNPIQLARYVDVFEAMNGVQQNYHDANVHPGASPRPCSTCSTSATSSSPTTSRRAGRGPIWAR